MTNKETLYTVSRYSGNSKLYLLHTPKASPMGAWEWTTKESDALKLPRTKARHASNTAPGACTTHKVKS